VALKAQLRAVMLQNADLQAEAEVMREELEEVRARSLESEAVGREVALEAEVEMLKAGWETEKERVMKLLKEADVAGLQMMEMQRRRRTVEAEVDMLRQDLNEKGRQQVCHCSQASTPHPWALALLFPCRNTSAPTT